MRARFVLCSSTLMLTRWTRLLAPWQCVLGLYEGSSTGVGGVDLETRQRWVQILGIPHSHCVTPGGLPGLSLRLPVHRVRGST